MPEFDKVYQEASQTYKGLDDNIDLHEPDKNRIMNQDIDEIEKNHDLEKPYILEILKEKALPSLMLAKEKLVQAMEGLTDQNSVEQGTQLVNKIQQYISDIQMLIGQNNQQSSGNNGLSNIPGGNGSNIPGGNGSNIPGGNGSNIPGGNGSGTGGPRDGAQVLFGINQQQSNNIVTGTVEYGVTNKKGDYYSVSVQGQKTRVDDLPGVDSGLSGLSAGGQKNQSLGISIGSDTSKSVKKLDEQAQRQEHVKATQTVATKIENASAKGKIAGYLHDLKKEVQKLQGDLALYQNIDPKTLSKKDIKKKDEIEKKIVTLTASIQDLEKPTGN